MNRYKKRYFSIAVLFTLICFAIFLYRNERERQKYRVIHNSLPALTVSSDETPVIIVDEHEEVIPYWYQAVHEGLIPMQGNTLIHIDAHSDMAPPENSEDIKEFSPKINPKYNNLLPLMQSNDVFIVSAIMKGLIDHVIWIQPSWNNDSQINRYMRSFVGISKTHLNENKKRSSCLCQQAVYKKLKKKTAFDCFIVDRETPDNKEIALSDCEMIRSYVLIMVSENRFTKSVKLNNIKELFIDIDEDYFGVQGGVQAFMDKGIRYNVVVQLDEILRQIFCPMSNKIEEDLNEIVKETFDDLWELSVAHRNDVNYRHDIKEILFKKVSNHVCPTVKEVSSVFQSIADYLSLLKTEELKGLSNIAYCLANSPRLHVQPRFGLCHGTIYPEDHLNQIHISNFTNIQNRAKNIENLLTFIYKHKTPKFFTIARSLRDGYTPRFQQSRIEEVLLKSISNVIKIHNKKERIVYDEFLVFGKKGWIFDEEEPSNI